MVNHRFIATATVALGLPLVWASAVSAFTLSGTVSGGDALAQGGSFIKLDLPFQPILGDPNTVGDDNFQAPNLYVFDEDQNIFLTEDLQVDVGDAIPSGSTVASHYIFFDPATPTSLTGTVSFDSEVLGIITSTDTLFSSDFLANTGVTYLNPLARGLEPNDSVTISGPNQITLAVTANTPGDYVRVITAFSPTAESQSTPEPGGLLGLLLVGLGLGLKGRRQRFKA